MFQNPENPQNRSWGTTCNEPIPSTPNRKIKIDNIYTCFLVTTTNAIVTKDNIEYYGVANKQIVTNPIKVNYDLQGGSGGAPQIRYGMLMDYGKMPMILSQLKQAINLMDGILKQMEMEAR